MKNSIRKSLLCSAALVGGFALSAGVASAKTNIHVVSNKTADAQTASIRNYAPTGSNALYTKAGVLKSARTVASASTMKQLGASKTGNDYFRLYRVAKLSNGSYYAKVVSFDKQYRGWIYVGKTNPAANYQNVTTGIKFVDTTKTLLLQGDKDNTQTNSTDSQNVSTTGLTLNQTYTFKNVGTQNDGSHLTYKAPMYTQYKLGRAIMDSTNYKNDKLMVTKAVSRTREGDVWAWVNDTTHPEASGWIKADGLVSTSNPTPDSKGNDQTTISSSYGRELVFGGHTFTGSQRINNMLYSGNNANYNWSKAINAFNKDATVKGNHKDVMPKSVLTAALAKHGLNTIYMKVSPEVAWRLPGGILDGLDSYSGLYMRFVLDTDKLPTTVHYGDQIRMTYRLDAGNKFIKPLFGIGANGDGYFAIPTILPTTTIFNAIWAMYAQ